MYNENGNIFKIYPFPPFSSQIITFCFLNVIFNNLKNKQPFLLFWGGFTSVFCYCYFSCIILYFSPFYTWFLFIHRINFLFIKLFLPSLVPWQWIAQTQILFPWSFWCYFILCFSSLLLHFFILFLIFTLLSFFHNSLVFVFLIWQ